MRSSCSSQERRELPYRTKAGQKLEQELPREKMSEKYHELPQTYTS